MYQIKGSGMVRDVFDQPKLEQLVGNMGVGHGNASFFFFFFFCVFPTTCFELLLIRDSLHPIGAEFEPTRQLRR